METYHGKVQTPQDAIILFEACRLGLLPRVQRRLSEKERQQIKSGSVFVWDEREAGMRRWTDGKSWSASRVSGSFLTYREMEGKRGVTGYQPAGTPAPKKTGGTRSSGASNNGDSDDGEGEGPDGYRYKPDGLMKQSFSITTQDGRHLHLISYFARAPHQPLKQPSSDPALRNIVPAKGMYPEATVNDAATLPAVTRGPMVASPYTAPPPPVVLTAYHPYPPPPGYHPYPPASWPASPAATPPTHYAYYPPHPGYPHSPYPPHMPPFPYQQHPGPGPPDRPPTQPHSSLPPPSILTHGHTHAPAVQWPPHPSRPPSGPPYAQNGSVPALHSNPYSNPEQRSDATSKPLQAGPQLAPVTNGFPNKPPTPPASSNGVTPPAKSYLADPPPIRDPASNGATTPTKIIPSINALINGNSHDSVVESRGDKNPSRSGSRSPANARSIRDVPHAMAAGGRERDKHDLKRLDSQLLKS